MSIPTPLDTSSTEQPLTDVEHDDEAVADLVSALNSRIPDADEGELRTLVTTALHELGPVRVTTFLPILVERRVRDLRGEASQNIAGASSRNGIATAG